MIEDALKTGAGNIGIGLSDEQSAKFAMYTELLLEWNEKFNLTSITDPAEIEIKHYLDSLTCLKAAKFPKGARIADVGTGAGFPGVPIAIARPDLTVVLIEATAKKLTFLEEVKNWLDLPNIELVNARVEDAGRLPEHREHYDIVVARAVADMRILAEYCLPLLKIGGKLVAQKGPDVEAEVDAARPGIGNLGGAHPEIIKMALPDTDINRSIVVIKKVKPTPEMFPRQYSRIKHKPL